MLPDSLLKVLKTQFGNFMIFLSLRFYVKIHFGDFSNSKSAILTCLDALSFDFYEIFALFEGWKLPIQLNSEPLKLQKRQIFEFLDSPKFISRKIWMTENSWNFHIVQKTMVPPKIILRTIEYKDLIHFNNSHYFGINFVATLNYIIKLATLQQ